MGRKGRRDESPMNSAHSPSSPSNLEGTPEIIIPSAWAEAANSIAHGPSPYSNPPIAFVCGPKNSGKTTFSRHLVNTLLQRYKSVGYLDTDVGQPEFTPPGCLSLHVLREQTTDLTILSLKTPVRCIFFGDISSKRDPKVYLSGIFNLYDHFIENYHSNDLENSGKPMFALVINTPGWVKGAGYEILVEMLRHIAPTHVVQIRISTESKNLPTGFFWLDGDHEAAVNLFEIYAARTDSFNRSVLVQKQSRCLRDIRLIAYFQQCIPRDVNITTHKELALALACSPPYEVPISGMKFMHLHCQVQRSEIFHSLNATIVGLGIGSVGATETEHVTPWCVGLGIVRGIDISKDLLYVLTPVPPSVLEKVDILLQGFIEIPTSLLQVRGCMSPYMSTNVLNKLGPLAAAERVS